MVTDLAWYDGDTLGNRTLPRASYDLTALYLAQFEICSVIASVYDQGRYSRTYSGTHG